MPGGVRITNNFGVCVPTAVAGQLACPASGLTTRINALIAAGQAPTGITSVITNGALTAAQLSANPILILTSVRVRDFLLNTGDGSTSTRIQSGYIQDDLRLHRDLQINFGVRWDFQQAYGTSSTYIKLNNWVDNLQPRVGVIWDFTGKGKGKIFANYARYLETPLPLDINVRAGGDDIQLDRNANVSRLNAAAGSTIVAGTNSGLGCLGCEATPVDAGLKPQTVNEWTSGIEYEAWKDLTLGFRGIYRSQGFGDRRRFVRRRCRITSSLIRASRSLRARADLLEIPSGGLVTTRQLAVLAVLDVTIVHLSLRLRSDSRTTISSSRRMYFQA